MAVTDPNIQINYGNFSEAPRAGTFATIDTSLPLNTRLLIKNDTGTTLATYSLSINLTHDVVALEYVGVVDLLDEYDGATFFSLEHYSSSQAVIRRWEMDTVAQTLNLQDVIIKTNAGSAKYDCYAFAVEHWHRTFATDESPDNTIQISSNSHLASGDKVWLGPSTDVDNPGAVEEMTVDYIYSNIVGDFVVFTADFNYEYVTGDPITYAKYIYLLSDEYGTGDRGVMYKLNAYDGSIINFATSAIFKDVTAAAWNNYYNVPTIIQDNMMYHISEPLGYVINRAHNSRLAYESNKAVPIEAYDLVVDGTSVYRLQTKATVQDDNGNLTTASWGEYNYYRDSQTTYTNVLKIWVAEGHYESNVAPAGSQIDIDAYVADQNGFPLSGRTITFTATGDPGGSWNPPGGQVTTNVNGYASIIYTIGVTTDGPITIKAVTDGGNGAVTGSAYVLCYMDLHSKYEESHWGRVARQIATSFSAGSHMVKQIDDIYTFQPDPEFGHVRQIKAVTNPGGHWGPSGKPSSDKRTIRQLASVTGEVKPQQWGATEDLVSQLGPPPVHPSSDAEQRMRQVEALERQMGLSQLYQAHHLSDYLSTDVSIDQFIFIVDVVPAWYSIKNPVVQYIYMRITPFAYSLDPNSYVLRVKNDWTRDGRYYSTGWKNVTDDCTILTFGAPTGLDVTYDPAPDEWEYNSRVYVWFSVYDTDPSGANLMDVQYWWDVIDDFRAPVITNEYPTPYSTGVALDTNISFDVTDAGLGVDPDTIVLALNGSLVEPLNLTTISGGYHCEYNPPSDFFYDQNITVTADAADIKGNYAHSTYYFTTGVSEGPWFHGAFPRKCARGIFVDEKVMLQVYGVDHGINTGSILVRIDRKDREIEMYPIIYRLS